MRSLSKNVLDDLKKNLKGRLILPTDSDYDEVRSLWNGMIDRHPAVIVECAEEDDAQHALNFAKSNNLELSIRGAGHNIAGNALCDDGLVVDFSKMRKVEVDPAKKIAYVEPGATLADLDEATQAHGLATPVGINSTTGIAGLTLGGGFGWLSRLYGMTIDNLLSADIITADGQKRHLSKDENQDLFWAIRGGGGNFGIVTRFEFRLHPVGPEIMGGLLVFDYADAKSILMQYRKFTQTAPADINAWLILRQAPPLPFLPEKVHGKPVVVLAIFYDGEVSEGEKIVDYLRKMGRLHGEHIGMQPYAQWQQAFDGLLTPGARNYWKTHNFTVLSEGLFDTMVDFAGRMPSPQCEIFIGHIDGVANEIPPDATAWGHRDVKYIMNVHARWDKASEDDRCIQWARSFFKASKPFASPGAYVNFMTEDEKDRVMSAYGTNYERLARIKKEYDPGNIFHVNQNIKPRILAK